MAIVLDRGLTYFCRKGDMDMALEILAPLGAFALFAFMVHSLCRMFGTISLNRTLREALKSSPESVEALAAKLEARQPLADGLLGWISLALAAGMLLLGMFEDAHERREIMQAAIVPALIGIVVLAYLRYARRDSAA